MAALTEDGQAASTGYAQGGNGRSPELPPAYAVCLVLALLCSVLSGNSYRLGLPIGPDRLFFAAGLTLLALDRRPWSVTRIRWGGVHLTMLAMVGLAGLSGLAVGTLTTSSGAFALLDRLIVPYLLFTFSPVLFATQAARRLLLWALTGLALYLGVTAVLEITGPSWLVFPRYVVDPEAGIQFGRARGPFLGSEALGLVLVPAGAAAGYLASLVRGWRRALAVVAVAASAAGVLLTLTRSVWVGAVVAALVVGIKQPAARRWLPVALVGVGLLLALVVAAVPSLQERISDRAGSTRSVYDRQNTNAAALRAIEEHPLTGVGWVRFVDVSDDYVRQSDSYPVTNVGIEVHNVALGRAAELGIAGALLWLVTVVLGPVRAALSRTSADLTGWQLVAIASLVSWGIAVNLSPVPYPLPNFLVFLLAGLVLSPRLIEGRGDAVSR